jgi:Flp pilus assembly CpaF family ATPase
LAAVADVGVVDTRALEASLREAVAREVTEQRSRAQEAGRVLDTSDQRQVARAVLQRELSLHSREALAHGRLPLPDGEREDLAKRVLTQVFSPLPGIEAFVGRAEAVNIHVMGCREVVVELLDGTVERHPSPYASNQALIDALAHIGRRGGMVEREFNYSHPILHLSLLDGSRLTANGWIGPEPYATVRRHPLIDHDLGDLSRLGMLDEGLRTLLGAATRAGWNILVAGGQGNGKTTLLRAITHEAPPDQRLVVLESEPELAFDKLPHRHNHVVNLCERPGNMQGEGAVPLDELTWHAKRLSPARLVVGEVLADEVVPMLEAMTQGVPGAATIHARTSAAVFPRLPVYARSRGRDWRSGDIFALAALALDLVVFVARDVDGRRVVAEVRHVHRYDSTSEQIVSDAWFMPDPSTRRAVQASVIPVHLLDELVAHGYEPQARRPHGPLPTGGGP